MPKQVALVPGAVVPFLGVGHPHPPQRGERARAGLDARAMRFWSAAAPNMRRAG